MTDALQFLRQNPFKCFVGTLASQDTYPQALKPILFPFHARILAVHSWVKGYFTFTDAVRLMLPGRWKSQELRTRFSQYVQDEITRAAKIHLREFIRDDGSIVLYGNPFYPYQGNYGELIDLIEQVFVLDQYQLKDLMKDGSVVIDAGANIGSFSVFAANSAKGVSIHAFEPVGKTFDVLRKNVSSYRTITAHRAGLGEKEDVRTVFFSKSATVGSSFDTSGERPSDEQKEDVTIMTIDGFVRQNGLERVDFIKMDTEGYEANILEGARDTIKRFRPIIVMSAYHHEGDENVLAKIISSIDAGYAHRLAKAEEEVLISIPR